ncbi:MAG: sensor histidine kinase, partial [Propionibacteriaceae bacterium]
MAVLYLGISHAVEWRFWPRIVYVLALVGADVAFAFSIGSPRDCVYYGFYLAIGIALLLPYDIAIYAMTLLLIVLIVIAAASPVDVFGLAMACGAALTGYSLINSLEQYRRRAVKAQEDERNASLAIAIERERIGRDLHDILGHSLTAIAVKADLAERLVAKDAQRAAVEIQELRDIARQALSDVRSTASGLRQVRLATELASSLSILDVAGIECVAPSAVPVFDEETSQQLGYVLRECMTNVVRHSAATRCEITLTEELLQVSDNGCGISGTEGTGLANIRQRASTWGEFS